MSSLPIVLFITDNGHGLGHLTRMMAVARHAGGRFQPLFLTMSQAHRLVRIYGWTVEYLPSYKRLKITRAEWGPMFASRVAGMIQHVKPRALVIDHIFPSPVLSSIRKATTGVDFIWSRRGMWREGLNKEAVRSSGYFDVIVEPRDVAGPLDVGLTSEYQDVVSLIDPVVFVADDERTDRERARLALGIPPEGRAVLIQLTDSNPKKLARAISEVRDVVTSVAGSEIVHLFAPLHPLHGEAVASVEGVMMRPVYPMAAHLNAFDGVVTTAGYNSFHEVVESGVPAIFVARQTSSLDDQARRGMFGSLSGRGFFAPTVNHPEFRTAVGRMLARGEPETAARVSRELGNFDGGRQFADLIAVRCAMRESEDVELEIRGVDWSMAPEVLDRIVSGGSLSQGSKRITETVVVPALGFTPAQLSESLSEFARLQESNPGLKPIFVLDDVDTGLLDEFEFIYEAIMTQSEYEALESGSYEQYLHSCIEGVMTRFQASRVIDLPKDSRLVAGSLAGRVPR